MNNIIIKKSQELSKKIAIIDCSRKISYAELTHSYSSLQYHYPILSTLPKNTIVPCLLDSSIASVSCFLGLINLGLVPACISPHFPLKMYEKIKKDLNAEIIIYSKLYNESLRALLERVSDIALCLDDRILTPVPQTAHNNIIKYEEKGKRELLFCLYTSGTTDYPSAVGHSLHDIIVMNKNYVNHVLKIKSDDILHSSSKLFFAYGINSILISLHHGASIVLPPNEVTPLSLIDSWSKHKPTVFFSVPSMYAKLLHEIPLNKKHLIPKTLISAGERLSKSLFCKWNEKFDTSIVDGIGCTETLSTFISNLPNEIKPGSSGKLVPGFQARIKDTSGKILGNHEIGVLWLKGDTYPQSYVNNEMATKERFVNGWYVTNDLFSKDDDGFYYCHGRLNDLIYKNGSWIFPARVEERINGHVNIVESAIMGHQSDRLDVLLIAFIVLAKNANIFQLENDLMSLNEAHDSYLPYEKINLLCIIDTLPRTVTGKIKRYILKSIIEQNDNMFTNLNETIIDMRGRIC